MFFFVKPENDICFFEKSTIKILSNFKVNFSLLNTEKTESLIITRLQVTRWVKLSLNFELLNFPNQLY